MELVHAIHFPKENLVKALFFDPLRNMLLSGSTQGVITIYEIGRPGKVESDYIYLISKGKTQHYNWNIRHSKECKTSLNIIFKTLGARNLLQS